MSKNSVVPKPRPISHLHAVAIECGALNAFAGLPKRDFDILQECGAITRISSLGQTAYERRIAVLDNPDIMYTMIERGMREDGLATLLGFMNRDTFRRWVKHNGLEPGVANAVMISADTYADMAVDQYQEIEPINARLTQLSDAVDDIMQIPDADFTEEHVRKIKAIGTSVDTQATIVKTKLSLAMARERVCARRAEMLNPNKYGRKTLRVTQDKQAVNLTFNMNFGEQQQALQVKQVNDSPNGMLESSKSSIPDGFNFGDVIDGDG